jgi:CO/xanthine dehydrogenase Mo-binding subunit
LLEPSRRNLLDLLSAVIAPAIGNAIFNAVGARVRSLPITAEAVKAAMKT